MALDDLFIHRVEVYARSGRRDRFGQPVDVNPRQHTEGETITATYPCRAYMKAGGLTMMERAIDTFESVWMMYTDLSAEIYEDDAVRIVDPRTGAVIVPLAKIKDAETVYDGRGAHHQEFSVWVQSGPNPKRP